MESVRLYLFKTETLNFVNLFQFCLYLSHQDLYQPCHPKFNQEHMVLDPGQFAKTFCPHDPCENFRNLDWSRYVHQLDAVLEKTNQSIVFGNNDIDQIHFLKSHYQDRVHSISCCYDKDVYDSMLNYATHNHFIKQNAGKVPATQFDLELRNDPNVDLFAYYKQAFHRQKLIPEQLFFETDYVVPIIDFFDKHKFFLHLAKIGGSQTVQADAYYDLWVEKQLKFFKESAYHDIHRTIIV